MNQMMDGVAGLSKLILNNKIVEFRKPVRQSRVHCISKLSRDIKKLKEKKGTDEQKAKNVKKAERYVQEIHIMKNLKDDEISKFALLNEKTLTDITNDVNESLEKKALARLVHHKTVAEKVRNFRGMFPEWKSCLRLLLDTLGEKYKHKKPTKAKTSRKTKTKVTNSSGPWTVQQRSKRDECVASSADESVTVENPRSEENEYVPSSAGANIMVENVADVETSPAVQKAVDSFFPTKDNDECVSISVKEITRTSDKERDFEPAERWQREFTSPKPRRQSHTSRNTKTKVTKNEYALLSDDENITVGNVADVETSPAVQGAVDSFFLTKDNDEYVSISAKEVTRTSDNERDCEPGERWQREFTSHKPKRQSHFDRRRKETSAYPSRWEAKKKNVSRSETPALYQPTAALHPSWEAKRKLTQPVRFEGKKIKFDPS